MALILNFQAQPVTEENVKVFAVGLSESYVTIHW